MIPHFSPHPGARPSCPLCSRLFDDGEPVCDCVAYEESLEDECPCCRDLHEERAMHDAYDRYAEEERVYDIDYDAEEHAFQGWQDDYAAWCAPDWDEVMRWDEELGWHLYDEDEYAAWRLAFPDRGWEPWSWWETRFAGAYVDSAEVTAPVPEPWSRWETLAEAAGF